LSFRDPDDIALELWAPLAGSSLALDEETSSD
jgi:hypothetical protein